MHGQRNIKLYFNRFKGNNKLSKYFQCKSVSSRTKVLSDTSGNKHVRLALTDINNEYINIHPNKGSSRHNKR